MGDHMGKKKEQILVGGIIIIILSVIIFSSGCLDKISLWGIVNIKIISQESDKPIEIFVDGVKEDLKHTYNLDIGNHKIKIKYNGGESTKSIKVKGDRTTYVTFNTNGDHWEVRYGESSSLGFSDYFDFCKELLWELCPIFIVVVVITLIIGFIKEFKGRKQSSKRKKSINSKYENDMNIKDEYQEENKDNYGSPYVNNPYLPLNQYQQLSASLYQNVHQQHYPNLCPFCSNPLTFSPIYQKMYCNNCKKLL